VFVNPFSIAETALVALAILICGGLGVWLVRKHVDASAEVPFDLAGGGEQETSRGKGQIQVIIDRKATDRTRARYQRIAPFYDSMEGAAERRVHHLRPHLWSMVRGPKVLEVGVGTGKNMPFYPPGTQITAIDLTPGMLERAQARAQALNLDVDLRLGDVQTLEFAANTFDDVVATCVFCSVPDPVLGLQEVARVVQPGGQVILLEHVRSANPLLGLLMDILNPLVVRMMGANINRRTVEHVQRSGLQLEHIEDVGMGGIFKLIVARSIPDPG
jgi:phosphatidylethanolamine/phosphatidyl-N-methylethanolamine N-methyltransferase